MLRVIAGTHRGRRLVVPPGDDVRPTSGRVREALFSMLGPMEGAHVLDIFAGSGALAIEAGSRGAAAVTLIESDHRAAAAIRKNLDALSIDGRLIERDWADGLRSLASAGERFDLVLVDPPYAMAGSIDRDLADLITPLLAAGSTVVVESDHRQPFDLGLPVTRERRHGDTLLRFHDG